MDVIRYKQIIKSFIPSSLMTYAIMKREHPDSSIKEVLRKTKLVKGSSKHHATNSFVKQSAKQYELAKIDTNAYYIYPYDSWVARVVYHKKTMITSVTPDYEIVIDSNLSKLEQQLRNMPNTGFAEEELKMISNIRWLHKKIVAGLADRKDERGKLLTKYIQHLLDNVPETLDEAIQKLLFYNALFWQAGHWQCGLGRLDLVLYKYYAHDLANGIISRESGKKLIRQMCLVLGKDMKAKSRALIGDTGQYILLGGIDKKGDTVQNDLTEIFLEVFTELKVPDPKLILRVNPNTSDVIWRKAINCILTGCGSPLIINEDLAMKGMIEFGYKKEDVWNFGTSACWEPLIIGKSFDQNNPLLNIPVVDSLNKFINEEKAFGDFDSFMQAYKEELGKQILKNIQDVDFDCSPLYSLFFDDCIKNQKDFSEGGATYAYHGVQIVSFPNLINALLNIKTYVFDCRLFSIHDCSQAIKADFKGFEDMREALLANPLKFGSTDKTVLNLTKELMAFISDTVAHKTMNGKKAKVGFSSSHYIIVSKDVGASLDGRHNGDPFAVHISPVSSKIDLQEVLDFAGSLDYSGNRMNGNVVDFILPKAYVDMPDKLVTILRNAMTGGVYELQLNVLDAATLKDAKAHPEKYPSLIVRVWGFSAYFNDLPEEYKDNLIKRAEAYAC